MKSVKGIRAAAAAALCILMLTACGKAERVPYLSGNERKKLETQFMDNIRLAQGIQSSTDLDFSFKNTSDHTLQDFGVLRADNGVSLISFPSIPAGCEVRCRAAGSEELASIAEKTDHQYRFRYTIGDYTYESPCYTIELNPSDEAAASDLTILLNTDSGTIPLDFSKIIEFPIGNEINGIESARIYSIESSANYDESRKLYYSVTLRIQCREPDSGRLICKVYDADGVVVTTASAYVTDEFWDAYLSTEFEPGVRYTLVFREVGGS